jgi:hypothetical protein
MTAATDFTRTQFEWLEKVAADPAIPATGFKLAFILSRHFNRKTGDAWPTQETLANAVGTSDRTIRTLVDLLVRKGHLEVRLRGWHNPNIYRMAGKPDTHARLNENEDEDRKPASTLKDERPEASFHPYDDQGGSFEQSGWKFSADRVEAGFLQNPLKEPLEELCSEQARDADASAGGLDEDSKRILFDEGLKWLAVVTNRSPAALRSAVGQMLKAARDDAGHVLAVLRRARRDNVADPVSWILGVLRSRQGPAPGPNSAPSSVPAGLVLSKRAARA